MAGILPALVAETDLLIGTAWLLILLVNIAQLPGYPKYRLADSSQPSAELVSVIIPARNEEKMIGATLSSVLAQTHRNLQVVVVDDRSSDKTAEVVSELTKQDARITLVHGAELPEDWAGKPWACQQGYDKAEGGWILFTDSDTILERGALAAAMTRARQANLKAISLVPRIELGSFWARVVTPVLSAIIRFVYPLRVVNNPESGMGLVVGGFLLIERDAYDAIGGHRAVRSELVEDKQIGANLKAKHIPFRLLMGRDLVTVGLFTGGQDVWNSVKRTVTNPLMYQRGMTTIFALGALALFSFPAAALIIGLATRSYLQMYSLVFLLSVAVPAIVVAYDAYEAKNSSVYYAALAMIGGIFIALAILRQLFGKSRVSWRGRSY